MKIGYVASCSVGTLFLITGFIGLSKGDVALGLGFIVMAGILFTPLHNLLPGKGVLTTGALKTSAVFGVMVISAILQGQRQDRSPTSTSVLTPVEASVGSSPAAESQPARKEPELVKENCQTVERMFGTQSKYSDIQKQELWKSYEGKKFTWKLEVIEVTNQMLSKDFLVHYRCVPSNSIFGSDVLMRYPVDAKQTVMAFMKGDVHKTSGILRDYSGMIGLQANSEE